MCIEDVSLWSCAECYIIYCFAQHGQAGVVRARGESAFYARAYLHTAAVEHNMGLYAFKRIYICTCSHTVVALCQEWEVSQGVIVIMRAASGFNLWLRARVNLEPWRIHTNWLGKYTDTVCLRAGQLSVLDLIIATRQSNFWFFCPFIGNGMFYKVFF